MQLTATRRPCGIIHVRQNYDTVYLPLQRVDVHAEVVDVSAIVTVTQYFWQPSPEGLPHAKYIFPVPGRAAVCGFEMAMDGNTIIKAVVKECGEAKDDYDTALRNGQTAALVERVTDDVFSISIGALPGNTVLSTTITYVLDLMDDGVTDDVRLQIPMYIGTRHGVPPPGVDSARQAPPHRVSISVDVHIQGTIRSIASPTHPTFAILDDSSTVVSRRAQYLSHDFLTQDFVLCIDAEGLDAPRCIAERTPAGALALQLNLVPKFDLPPIPSQEYIFLIDRSYSMHGSRIETAKNALVMLLRALPSRETHFNIFSFGRKCDSLWPESVEYNGETLGLATQHVEGMEADYGPGTKIQEALEQVFASRRNDKPTSCFLLTDGEAWNFDGTFKTVNDAVGAEAASPLRVFTLGIGSTTSTEMCEGISRAGRGLCEMAVSSESIIGKCSKLVRASRTYVLQNVSSDWKIPTNANSARSLRQAPDPVPAVYPGHRFQISALLEDADIIVPHEVALSGQRDGQGDVLRFCIPVRTVQTHSGWPRGLVATLAARRLIMDLDDAERKCPSPAARSAIISLSTTYGLASRYTSLIAVDTRSADEVSLVIEGMCSIDLADEAGPTTRGKRRRAEEAQTAEWIVRKYSEHVHAVLGATAPRRLPPPDPTTYRSSGRRGAGGKGLGKGGASRPTAVYTKGKRQAARKTTSALAAAPTSASTSTQQPPDATEPPAKKAHVDGTQGSTTAQRPSDATILALVRLQTFDGAFPATSELAAILGKAALAEAQALKVPEEAWSTLLAVAFLKQHLRDRALLEGLVEKALEYVGHNVNVADLLARAQEFVR